MKFIDLSHTIEDGMITYKGLPAPIICDYLSREKSREFYEDGTEFHIGKLEMIANTGTYIDCPFHRYPEGKDLSDSELDKFAELDGVLIKNDHRENGLEIGPECFSNRNLEGKAVLVNTSWDKKWRTDSYFENHPYLTEEAAKFLVEQKVKLVGIDSYNIDNTKSKRRPVHSVLLKNDIFIVEHLTTLDKLPNNGFHFFAVPPKIKGMGTFPVRAYAKI
ncbi:cyclase family protein [Xanthovirga aplysinae]|uniref:cyclase family protein n=1 Tax=Xanthovirga aplysinae TaxID=2529853 RepID=UPI0012BD7E46|nr:cyclase family protein [Xanthovirga aplysinae]MTI29667.1 cyclase family protein [Xanthovirga aplysinae]